MLPKVGGVRILTRTSPLMTGDDVKQLQILLRAHAYLKGTIDGQYGDLTAQAVYRAKFWLGYRKPDHDAADLLLEYLQGKRKPTPVMRGRVRLRKKQLSETPIRVKALRWLTEKIGEKEHPPNSNRVSWASIWYGVIGPWCAMAATRAYLESGSTVFKRGSRYAYVPFIVADARAGRNGLSLAPEPRPGDLVCYDWERNGVADHVGLFEKWVAGGEGTEFLAVEGNTGVGNDSNGGEVMRRTRKIRDVQAFVHVGR